MNTVQKERETQEVLFEIGNILDVEVLKHFGGTVQRSVARLPN